MTLSAPLSSTGPGAQMAQWRSTGVGERGGENGSGDAASAREEIDGGGRGKGRVAARARGQCG
ncbi:hypothetical protein E2562_003130 [Oryza meyeriana var. granulata]|uniref:DUF834 domain-containing protein n=1 Tax=Oryza meyeriana var. granulata TaxID=110450 RepID=A0A6G1E974_9ORYZ|nr:hypothetical protein E2562_003130 [Oryza meyeriana var. granulata]